MDYSGLNAKIKALRGMLITRKEYEALSRMKSDEELRNRLNELHEYRKAMENITADSRRYKIEQNIYLSFSDELNRIYSFIGDYNIRKFLDAFYLNNEIRIIKILLRMVYDEREIDFSYPELMVLIGKSLKIDVNRVKSAKTPPELIECLKGTQIYSVLARFYTINTSLFELEAQLDLYYYMQICKVKGKNLAGDDRKIVNKIIGTEIDFKNMIWIYRLKTFYNPANNIIYTYLIPYSYRLNRYHLSRMIEAKSNEELMAEINNGPYAPAFAGNDNIGRIERIAERELMKLYSLFEVMYPNSIATTIAYLFYKEKEVQNVISLIEGVRYKLESKEILSYLVLKADDSRSYGKTGGSDNRGESN